MQLLALFVVCLTVVYVQAAVPETARYFQTRPDCSRVNGICLPQNDCTDDNLKTDGVCNEGSVCCKEKNETRCRLLGGDCIKHTCPSFLQRPQATDCSSEKTCCVLIN